MLLAYLLPSSGRPARTARNEPPHCDPHHRRVLSFRGGRASHSDRTSHFDELAYFIDNFPLYIKRMRGSRPIQTGVAKQAGRRRPSLRGAIGRGTNHIGDRLAPICCVQFGRRPRADLSLLSPSGHSDRCAALSSMVGRRWWRLSISGYRRRSAIPSVLLLREIDGPDRRLCYWYKGILCMILAVFYATAATIFFQP